MPSARLNSLGFALPSKSVSVGLEASIFLGAGLLAAFYVVWLSVDIWKVQQSLNWTKVDGTIVAVQVRDAGRKVGSCLELTYAYQFEGGKFSGTNRTFGRAPCGKKDRIKEIAQSYVPGAHVNVYINPYNVFESVLLPGVMEGRTWISMGVSLLLSVGGFWCGIVILSKEKNA